MADPVWKGIIGTAAHDAWRASFEPGYKPVVVSPRDTTGAYDPKGNTFTILTEKDHATEIAVALSKEGVPIPKSIVDTLKAKIGITSNDVKKTHPPTGTVSKPSAKDEITGRSLVNKYTESLKADPNVIGVILVIVTAIVLYMIKKN